MSAGICIMNRNAIAMAADSAVTIGNRVAIHNSANKLFSLSKIAPVGVIIYANASFMGVPFEIIIKEYKKYIGDKTFKTLKEYLFDFINYLEHNAQLFHFDCNEEAYIMNVFENLMHGLNNYFKYKIDEISKAKGSKLSERELLETAKEAIKQTESFINNQELITNASFLEYICNKYKSKFIDYLRADKKFDWIADEQKRDISEKACKIFDSKFDRNGYVGLAIAGYGESEIYPSLIHIHLSGYINKSIRYYIFEEAYISEDRNTSVIPLAQTDVMQTFLFGINDQLLGDLAQEIPKQITDSLQKMDDSLFALNKKNDVLNQLVKDSNNILEHIIKTSTEYFMTPIYESVASLPIEELGLLAESMINITSIRRKVAIDSNIGTVGGPIDVSIISKGDGFIWLKRKHYFDKNFNPQFFYSHYAKN